MPHTFEQQVSQLIEMTDRIIEKHPKSTVGYLYFRHSLKEAFKPIEDLNAAIKKMETEGLTEAPKNPLVQLMKDSRDTLLRVGLLLRVESAKQAVEEGSKEASF